MVDAKGVPKPLLVGRHTHTTAEEPLLACESGWLMVLILFPFPFRSDEVALIEPLTGR